MNSSTLLNLLQEGRYVGILNLDGAKPFIEEFVKTLDPQNREDTFPTKQPVETRTSVLAGVGVAALHAFLQTNVTGPVLAESQEVEDLFVEAYELARPSEPVSRTCLISRLRTRCSRSLDVDGVSPYPYIPNIELFCLARWALTHSSTDTAHDGDYPGVFLEAKDSALRSLAWLQLRVHVWHYRLLTQPHLGAGSVFNKSAQWSDVPGLQEEIEKKMDEVDTEVIRRSLNPLSPFFGRKDDKVYFLLEKVGVHIMFGRDAKAKETLKLAAEMNRFAYALSGALGKRTRFQENSISQLVVLAKSTYDEGSLGSTYVAPEALPLNDDTLLESIDFQKNAVDDAGHHPAGLPDTLKDMPPDEQPQLAPLDQIILLTEATLKDAFSPADSLTSEEILPYAVRVVSDTSTNWQIYTQALLVRSRIEVHRSRTLERGVLQMQALVDQVLVDSAVDAKERDTGTTSNGETDDTPIPTIQITTPGSTTAEKAQPNTEKPTSFFPAADASNSAPAQTRLQYVHALSSPPRWHLESELGYAWVGVGSLISALEIFKRLRLWAEVALCLASSAAAENEDGRGSGGEEKARAILRWRLFHRTGTTSSAAQDEDSPHDEVTDITDLTAADFTGPERTPPPPNAPRLLCILGDLESEPAHYERAWTLSRGRYARAQRALGEHHLQRKDWPAARDAYARAVAVSRLSPELWSRLGDIQLRLGDFGAAAAAFARAIGSAGDAVGGGGDDARTWSNLGSALYSLYLEAVERQQGGGGASRPQEEEEGKEDGQEETKSWEAAGGATPLPAKTRDAATLLAQSLAAYKRGATIAQTNWRIWDNVLTLASRARPPAVPDMVLALRAILKLRPGEDALDAEVLRLLLTEAVLAHPRPETAAAGPARGSLQKAVCDVFEEAVVPRITRRSELWGLVGRERVWRRNLAGAVEAAERGWRAAVATTGGEGGSAGGGEGGLGNWLEEEAAFSVVVARTDELVSMLENYGPEVEGVGERWRGKARSAVRSVLGKGRERWEGSEGWMVLERLMEGLR